ncbi:MAG: hypothetical protein J3K34DRAFT_441835 [Monoraphidium minutum]|nr:MAG: hypothetical protein J3K34DRAFT_441835 [Monoraphidium minutum]
MRVFLPGGRMLGLDPAKSGRGCTAAHSRAPFKQSYVQAADRVIQACSGAPCQAAHPPRPPGARAARPAAARLAPYAQSNMRRRPRRFRNASRLRRLRCASHALAGPALAVAVAPGAAVVIVTVARVVVAAQAPAMVHRTAVRAAVLFDYLHLGGGGGGRVCVCV